jgi:uncharacterized glyoxalase superfamily protein PhnB
MATKRSKKQARSAKKAGAGAAKAKPKARADARMKPKAKGAVQAGVPESRKQKSLRLRTLSPSFTVNDLGQSLLFYVEVLGFTVKDRWEHGGRLMGVMLAAGRCELGIGQDDWAKGRDRVKGVGFRIYAETVQDLGALAERIRAHGFTAQGPTKESWGATTVTVTDPDGFKLTFTEE